ncbi:MAG: M23 family metallopeptidase, partial [Nitrospirales bacterium]
EAVKDQASRTRVAGRECGNGVLIDHPGGWQTQYCHLRQGSIRVKPGEQVARGTALGLVGLSGKTEFPHLHLTLRRDGEIIDPFTGRFMRGGCKGEEVPLWRAVQPVPYEDVALYNAGFSGGPPHIEAIRQGREEGAQVAATAPALVLWVDMFGVQAGDQLRLRITGPDGHAVLEYEQEIERTQARRFAFAGKRLKGTAWPAGVYTGLVTLTRALDGRPLTKTLTRRVTVQ